MDPQTLMAGLGSARLLAIIRGADEEACFRTAITLIDEGVAYLEVSLNSANAPAVIARIRREAGDDAGIGAGTVLTADDVARVADAGAGFVVTPAFGPSLEAAVAVGLPVLAGALTPSEAYAAMTGGASAIKLFPASLGGPAYLKALRDPFPDVPFVPVGGVDLDAAAEYLRRGAFAVGVGSPLIGDAAAGGDIDALRTRARDFLAVVRDAPQ
ncbi:bifunctional 4-hydroxy-2-oxoglutarate aldolase/2-dehydro-3-deoxy-phosphogluconate aldolase [Arthrobacter sp. Soc17.1.1.1]|uniref:bifunctional 4-hydroxy-2-oxoglutarate aldolase/2-dehydro-3-deoxy-phosphogluconate aldolase n=1 Tax=Arthrobacter sp. Soc17.1.1.1 TaxID=3121277 RepID=UPI002FE45A46